MCSASWMKRGLHPTKSRACEADSVTKHPDNDKNTTITTANNTACSTPVASIVRIKPTAPTVVRSAERRLTLKTFHYWGVGRRSPLLGAPLPYRIYPRVPVDPDRA